MSYEDIRQAIKGVLDKRDVSAAQNLLKKVDSSKLEKSLLDYFKDNKDDAEKFMLDSLDPEIQEPFGEILSPVQLFNLRQLLVKERVDSIKSKIADKKTKQMIAVVATVLVCRKKLPGIDDTRMDRLCNALLRGDSQEFKNALDFKIIDKAIQENRKTWDNNLRDAWDKIDLDVFSPFWVILKKKLDGVSLSSEQGSRLGDILEIMKDITYGDSNSLFPAREGQSGEMLSNIREKLAGVIVKSDVYKEELVKLTGIDIENELLNMTLDKHRAGLKVDSIDRDVFNLLEQSVLSDRLDFFCSLFDQTLHAIFTGEDTCLSFRVNLLNDSPDFSKALGKIANRYTFLSSLWNYITDNKENQKELSEWHHTIDKVRQKYLDNFVNSMPKDIYNGILRHILEIELKKRSDGDQFFSRVGIKGRKASILMDAFYEDKQFDLLKPDLKPDIDKAINQTLEKLEDSHAKVLFELVRDKLKGYQEFNPPEWSCFEGINSEPDELKNAVNTLDLKPFERATLCGVIRALHSQKTGLYLLPIEERRREIIKKLEVDLWERVRKMILPESDINGTRLEIARRKVFEPEKLQRKFGDINEDSIMGELLREDIKALLKKEHSKSGWPSVDVPIWMIIHIFLKRYFKLSLLSLIALAVLFWLVCVMLQNPPHIPPSPTKIALFNPLDPVEGPPLVCLARPTQLELPHKRTDGLMKWDVYYVSRRPVSDEDLSHMLFENHRVCIVKDGISAADTYALYAEQYVNNLEIYLRRKYYHSFDSRYGASAKFSDFHLILLPSNLANELLENIDGKTDTQTNTRKDMFDSIDSNDAEIFWIGLGKVASKSTGL